MAENAEIGDDSSDVRNDASDFDDAIKEVRFVNIDFHLFYSLESFVPFASNIALLHLTECNACFRTASFDNSLQASSCSTSRSLVRFSSIHCISEHGAQA